MDRVQRPLSTESNGSRRHFCKYQGWKQGKRFSLAECCLCPWSRSCYCNSTFSKRPLPHSGQKVEGESWGRRERKWWRRQAHDRSRSFIGRVGGIGVRVRESSRTAGRGKESSSNKREETSNRNERKGFGEVWWDKEETKWDRERGGKKGN